MPRESVARRGPAGGHRALLRSAKTPLGARLPQPGPVRARISGCVAARSAASRCSPNASTALPLARFGYFGSVTPSWCNQCCTVFLDSPVRRQTSRIDTPSRKCIRRILANMSTLITPRSPARFLSRAVSLRGSVFDDHPPQGPARDATIQRSREHAEVDAAHFQPSRRAMRSVRPTNWCCVSSSWRSDLEASRRDDAIDSAE
jgi:hypothetical protein